VFAEGRSGAGGTQMSQLVMSHGLPGAGLLLALTLAAAAAQEPPADPTHCPAAKGPLAGLIDWIVAEGHPETLPTMVLGLAGEGDVPIRQKAYRNPGTRLVHAADVNVAEGHCDVVFIIDDRGGVTTWVTNIGGQIERTFHMSSPLGENESVPNERYASEFETTKSYFLEKLPGRYAPP